MKGIVSGAAVGALAGGPIGALDGAGVGAGAGTVMPEGADQIAGNAIQKEHRATRTARNDAGLGGSSRMDRAHAGLPRDTVRQAQQQLKAEGFYSGSLDGLLGKQTRDALAAYQQKKGLPQTATLDRATLESMNLEGAQRASGEPNTSQMRSGSAWKRLAILMWATFGASAITTSRRARARTGKRTQSRSMVIPGR
jgi:peptidoglycan hydrolase-like protein with peptidoglycan-binding domain